MIEGEDACAFCGTKTYDEFWGPSCCAGGWCHKEVEAIKAERESLKLQVEAYRKAFEEIRRRGHEWLCPQSSSFRDGDCICDETWPDPVVKA